MLTTIFYLAPFHTQQAANGNESLYEELSLRKERDRAVVTTRIKTQ